MYLIYFITYISIFMFVFQKSFLKYSLIFHIILFPFCLSLVGILDFNNTDFFTTESVNDENWRPKQKQQRMRCETFWKIYMIRRQNMAVCLHMFFSVLDQK